MSKEPGAIHALGAAVREAVIETCIQTGQKLQIRAAVLRSQTDALHQNPMFRKAQIANHRQGLPERQGAGREGVP